MRIAAIDVGTNTAQLLVAEAANDGLRRILVAERFVRLGEGVDEHANVSPEATRRLLDTLREHLETARDLGVNAVTVAGTSALRDAANRDAVLDRVENEVGLSVEILSGDEEATWSFAAACSAFDDLEGTILVADIGGGSTELVAGSPPAPLLDDPVSIAHRVSLDLGCVRLTERYFRDHPPSATAVASVQRLIDERLEDCVQDLPAFTTLVGTAGTATALALVDAGPDSSWDALEGDGFRLSHTDVCQWRQRLFELSVADIRSLHPRAMKGRADVFPVGVLLLDRIMNQCDAPTCRVSPYELRHGLALRALTTA